MKRPTSRFGAFCILVCLLTLAFAALAVPAKERNTQRSNPAQTALVAGEDIPAGVIAAVWTNGLCYAAADTNALAGARVVGVVVHPAQAGGTMLAQRGKFRLDNDGAVLTAADIGSAVYVAGPASVTTQARASQDIAAGILSGMATSNTDGTNNAVWVNIGW